MDCDVTDDELVQDGHTSLVVANDTGGDPVALADVPSAGRQTAFVRTTTIPDGALVGVYGSRGIVETGLR